MSRIGKKPIEIPQGVQVQIEGKRVMVKGPKGELSREFADELKIEKNDNHIVVSPRNNSQEAKALWGLTRTLLFNMVAGVTEGYAKKLEIEGIGYRASVEGDSLSLNVGYTHPVKIEAPERITFAVDKNVITVAGINKEDVGETAARIRAARPVEPYKGKGIKYQGEVIRRKLGKKAAGTTGSS